MTKFSLFFLLLILGSSMLFAQVGVNADGSSPDPSAMLDLKSTSKGFLPPRLSILEISSITSPAEGLIVYNTTDSLIVYYNGTGWRFADGTACWTCGDTLHINHDDAGGVAPVDKQVTYGTVMNVPGAVSKCWITRNLGASQQATAVNDATEASAGWHWQFNLKQGYQHDGATRIPGTAWISSIDENSDWTIANDPCTLELGTGWRIPTYTEWYNVDNTGGWTDYYGPWNSTLKMHAAGYLHTSNGSLYNRGVTGYYWSSTQYNTTIGWYLFFNSGGCSLDAIGKAFGFTLRCIRE